MNHQIYLKCVLFCFQFTGAVHDSGDLPCERVYIGFNVIRSVFSGCASSDEYVITNRAQCNAVSSHFYANAFPSLFRWLFWIFNYPEKKTFNWPLVFCTQHFISDLPKNHFFKWDEIWMAPISWSSFPFCLFFADSIVRITYHSIRFNRYYSCTFWMFSVIYSHLAKTS